MSSLRVRLISLWILLAMAMAAIMFIAVERFSSEQVMDLAMAAGASAADAKAMFDEYVGRVLIVGAGLGLVVGTLAAWWLLRRILRPLERTTAATRAISAGDLAARVPDAPDRELQRLADAFNQMAANLERTERLRRVLVEDVAHELRTPLTSLQGFTEALADGLADPSPEMLRNLHEEIVRLTHLVNELDELARGERRNDVPPRGPVDLVSAVERAVTILTPDLVSRGIDVRIEGASRSSMVVANADAIGQVVSNLMQNAARHADPGGEIVVRFSEQPDTIRCSIENTGAEIPVGDLPFIWERLYRADHARSRSSGGAGIGLAIVRQVVEAHGGEVGARSQDGRTEIWFELPFTRRGGMADRTALTRLGGDRAAVAAPLRPRD